MFYDSMIKILPSVKLPLKLCKGSYAERIALAKKLNNNFFNHLNEKFTTKEVPFDVFEKTLKECTPGKINVNILQYDRYGGYTCFGLNDSKNGIDKFLIYFRKTPYTEGVRLLETDISLHETSHYFCHLTNPKHSARSVKMHESGLQAKTEDFYREHLYTKNEFKEEDLKQKLNKFLRKFTNEEQIDFLQNCRYRMLEEYIAFDDGQRYLDIIQDRHPDLICEKIYAREKEVYNFPEKIKIVTDKLKEVLQNARKP